MKKQTFVTIVIAALIATALTATAWRHNPASTEYITPQYSFDVAVARGDVDGHTQVTKFGSLSNVGSTWETVWSYGTTKVWPTVAYTLSVVSADADDAAADTGAITLRLEGLDDDLAVISETVTLTGTTPVVTTQAFYRLNRAYVLTAGSSRANEGAITITQSTGGIVMGYITAGLSQTQMMAYTVPAGYSIVNESSVYAVDGVKSADFRVMIRLLDSDPTTAPFTPWRQISTLIGETGVTQLSGGYSFLPAGTDIEVQAEGASTPSVSVAFRFKQFVD